MRRVASFPTHEPADRLVAVLQMRGIAAGIEERDGECVVCILDDAQWAAAQTIAADVSPQTDAVDLSSPALNVIEPTPRRRRRTWTFRLFGWIIPPITIGLIVVSAVVSLLTHFGDKMEPVGTWMGIQPFWMGRGGMTEWLVDDSPWSRIADGEVWRLWTPMFLHFRWWHLLGNVMWTYSFCGAVEFVRGPWRVLGLVLVSSAVSNVAQYMSYGPGFGGLSGVGYALFGYVWMKSRYYPEARLRLPRSVFWMFWGLFILCVLGLLGPIANTAHVAGLIVGILYGLVPRL